MDNHVTFSSDYPGKLLQPNIANASTVAIFDWDNMTNTLYVQGDITSYVAAGDAYRVEMPDGGSGVEECNSGFWDAAPSFASGETTFTAVQTAHFRDFQAGWLLIPDVTKPAYVRIKEIDATDDFKLTVEGDVTDLAGAGARFRVVAPVGTDQDSGEAQLDPWTKASRWLWAGYMYEPPLVGYTSATGVERKAPGPDNDPATPDANLRACLTKL